MSSVDLNNLSIEDLKKIKQNKKNNVKEEFNDYNEQKEKLIAESDEIEKQRKNIKKAKSKKEKPKKPSKPMIKPKPKSKTFADYFEECIKSKKIPKDSPSYFKKSSRKSDERVWCWNQKWKVSSWEFCRQI